MSKYPLYFLYHLTLRRSYFTLMSVYFLTLPHTTAQQIGIWGLASVVASFLLEIPSGYFSDRFGHKFTMLWSKIFMLLASILFVLAGGFWFFLLATIFWAMGMSSHSGSSTAYFHEFLDRDGKDNRFSELHGKVVAQASLVSAFLIVGFPFLVHLPEFSVGSFSISGLKWPFLIHIGIDLVGLVATWFLPDISARERALCKTPLLKKSSQKTPQNSDNFSLKNFWESLPRKELCIWVVIFSVVGSGFMKADGTYRYVYLEDLGLAVMFFGLVMGGSRVLWWMFSFVVYRLQKLSLWSFLWTDVVFFAVYYNLVFIFQNPYVVAMIFAMAAGYNQARRPVMQQFLLDNFCCNKKYKATFLSIRGQIEKTFEGMAFLLLGATVFFGFRVAFFMAGIFVVLILLGVLLGIRVKKNLYKEVL